MMAHDEQDADDLAVNLSWQAGGPAVAGRRPPGQATPPSEMPPLRPAPRRAPTPSAEPDPAPAPRPAAGAAPPGARAGAAGPPRQAPAGGPRPRPSTPRPTGGPRPPAKRPAPPTGRASGARAKDAVPADTLLDIVEHLSTLSRLVTGTTKATSAELAALGARVDQAVTDLDALQSRVVRSLAGFDVLRLRVQKELADRPPLTDDDIERIADSVTRRLLDHVRVETEEPREPAD